jgi:hypothetical protein
MSAKNRVRMTTHWIWQGLYLLGFVVSLIVALGLFVAARTGGALLFLTFSFFIGLNFTMARAYVEVDSDQIFIHGPPFGDYLMRWDDVQRVESNGLGYRFHGDNQALGFRIQKGTHKAGDLRRKISAELTRRGIELQRTTRTPTGRQKNVRVS